jgi:hypothetical protein
MNKQELIIEIEKTAKEANIALPKNWKNLSPAKLKSTIYDKLKADITKQTPPEEPTPEQPTQTTTSTPQAEGAFMFGGREQDINEGTASDKVIEEAQKVSAKAGYIQGLADNRTGYPRAVKDLSVTLMKSKDVTTQQACIAKLIYDVMRLLGYNWNQDAFKRKDGTLNVSDPPVLDTAFTKWFIEGGAALVGQFSALSRNPEFVEKFREFVKTV